MNFLAKHFFDYQSFVNLPHTAVQMHKTPPSQAGCDPSASWGPKDLHVAGKNQAAPAARANRSYHGDQRTGSHRHGRPSKLEFRNWGERHGELREEKIVPHKEHFFQQQQLDGSTRRHSDHFPSEYFPARALLRPPVEVMLILTATPRLDFITVTVKAVRGLQEGGGHSLHLRLCDGVRLLEERRGTAAVERPKGISSESLSKLQQRGGEERELCESFLLKAPAPLRLPFCHLVLSLCAPLAHQSEAQTTAKAGFPEHLASSAPISATAHRGNGDGAGSCQLGPAGSSTRGHAHWRQMLKKLGAPVPMWHELAPSGPKQRANSPAGMSRGTVAAGGGRSAERTTVRREPLLTEDDMEQRDERRQMAEEEQGIGVAATDD